ncbi:MAG: YCF48-related protein [Rhodothermales bacterium]
MPNAPRITLAVLIVALLAAALWLLRPDSEEKDPARPPVSGAYEALVMWTMQRAYPGTELPSEGVAEALAVRRALEAESRGGGDEVWESIGPDNVGGRTLALAINPERPESVWAGSAGGGLWRSYTGGTGAAWERVPTGFGVTAASAVVIAPGDTSTVYLGTGEVYRYGESTGGVVYRPTRGSYGMGILKSTDGGATWATSLDWSRNQERGVQMLRFDPTDDATLWAATTEGIYVTRDAGATWTLSLDVVMGTDVTVNPANPDDVLAVCGNQESPDYGFYRTTDGGETWAQVTDGLPTSYIGKVLLSRHPTEAETIYASIGDGIFSSGGTQTYLVRTTDGGDSWETLSTFDYARFQGWFAHYVGVNPLDPDVLYLGGVNMYRSNGEGQNITQLNPIHADNHAVAFHPTDPDIVYLAGDGGVYRTTDGGDTIENLEFGMRTAQFYNGTSVSADGAYMLGGLQDNGTVRMEEGEAWDHVFGGDGTWTAIDPSDPDIAYASSQGLNLRRSSDGGFSFTAGIAPPFSDETAFIAPYAVAPSAPSTLYAGRSIVYKSTNRGTNWTATNGGANVDPNGNPPLALAVSPVDEDVVYVATAPLLRDPVDNPGPPRLFVTRDGGDAWTDITLGLPDRFVVDIAVHPTDDATVWVTMGGFGTPHVFKTEDSGATWTDVTGPLPDAPTNAVAFDPLAPDTVFVGNDVGVFVTRDAGATWEAFSDGLPEAVLVMDLVAAGDRTLRVATHGNGVYRRPLVLNPVAAESDTAPTGFRLSQNAPNPFRDRTTLGFELDRPGDVRLEVFDAAGRRVATLAEGRRAAGSHTVAWDADGLASGVYFARLSAGGSVATRQMTLVR